MNDTQNTDATTGEHIAPCAEHRPVRAEVLGRFGLDEADLPGIEQAWDRYFEHLDRPAAPDPDEDEEFVDIFSPEYDEEKYELRWVQNSRLKMLGYIRSNMVPAWSVLDDPDAALRKAMRYELSSADTKRVEQAERATQEARDVVAYLTGLSQVPSADELRDAYGKVVLGGIHRLVQTYRDAYARMSHLGQVLARAQDLDDGVLKDWLLGDSLEGQTAPSREYIGSRSPLLEQYHLSVRSLDYKREELQLTAEKARQVVQECAEVVHSREGALRLLDEIWAAGWPTDAEMPLPSRPDVKE